MSKPQKNIAPAGLFMTPAEGMKVLKLGRDSFYKLLKRGEIPGAMKFGKQWRIEAATFWETVKERGSVYEKKNK